MVRIGIIGPESSRPQRFVAHLDRRGGDDQIVAIVPTAAASELMGQVDVVIDCTRDARLHRATVLPFLEAGIHAFVDKPLATTVADGRALLDAARASGVALMSYSGYRRALELPAISTWMASAGRPRTLRVSGPADPGSEYAGLFYYGIHHVEIAQRLLGPAALDDALAHELTVDRRAGDLVATVDAGGTTVEFTFVPPDSGTDSAFTVAVDGAAGQRTQALTLPADYNELMLDEFLHSVPAGQGPHSDNEILASVALLEAISARL